MSKLKVCIIIVIIAATAAVVGRFAYMRFIKTYEIGKDPKLYEITNVHYTSGMYSSDNGYVYNEYTVRKRDQKYYARADVYDEEKGQTVSEAEITGAEYGEIIKLREGCRYVREGRPDPKVMDGFMDTSSYTADIIWPNMPGGAWDLVMDPDTRSSFVNAVTGAVRTINISFIDEVEQGSVWILRDTTENRKTSVWGTAMIKPEETGKEYDAAIPLSADDKYLFRMIDEDSLYYEAEIPKLQEGWKLRLYTGENVRDIYLEALNDKGESVHEASVFCAAL